MADKNEFVELKQAWFYVCDSCGRDNFIRAIAIDISDAEKEAYLSDLKSQIGDMAGGADEIQGGLFMAPNQVTCKYCRKKFNTVEDIEEENNSDTDI